LAVTAVFDKPHTPDGPTFEETLPVPVTGYDRARPSGVFMLPVPCPGVLRAVEGRADVAAVPGITGLTITIPVGQRVLPLPDGTGTWVLFLPRPTSVRMSSRRSSLPVTSCAW
jgi:hypothetical protein